MTPIMYIDRRSGEQRIETPPAQGIMRWLYGTSLGQGLLPLVRRKVLTRWYGSRMDKPPSAARIPGFVKELDIDMSESLHSIADFGTFNEFFYRRLKPDARPIAEGFVSPGDGRLLAFDRVAEVSDFFVKGQRFTLGRFLSDEMLASRYADGQMLILRLAPNDYHRYHSPAAGVPTAQQSIHGVYYSVSPIALAWDFARVFCENKRAYCLLETESYGDVLIAPVGATMVGSIRATYTADQPVAKGDEMGYFAFGGSTLVVLIEPGRLTIDEDLLSHTRAGKETYVRMGERVAM